MIKVCMYLDNAYGLFARSKGMRIGGAEINFYALACDLVRSGLHVDFMVKDFGQPNQQVIDGVCLRKIPGTADRAPGARAGIISRLLVRWQVLRMALSTRADVYLVTTSSETCLYLWVAAALRRKPSIYRMAADANVDFSIGRMSMIRRVFNLILPRYTQIVCQNSAQLEKLGENFGREGTLIPNQIPLVPSAVPWSNRQYHLWVGRNEALKRADLVRDLAVRMPGASFALVFSDGPVVPPEVQRHFEGLPNVKLIPSTPFFEIHTLFAHARSYLNTSDREGFPNTFLQAWAAGTPVCSLRIDPNDHLRTGGGGLYANGDFEQFQRNCACLENEAEWTPLSETAAALSKQLSARNESTARYLSLIREVVGEAE